MCGRIWTTSRPVKTPGADYPIVIEPNANRIVISLAGQVIADTQRALTLHEAGYPPIHYIPRKDVNMMLLERTEYTTYCPYKGECAYYSLPLGGARCINAVWTYENPYPAVRSINDHLAFQFNHIDYD
jgi:uncharacterized protein (DUF427 family)